FCLRRGAYHSLNSPLCSCVSNSGKRVYHHQPPLTITGIGSGRTSRSSPLNPVEHTRSVKCQSIHEKRKMGLANRGGVTGNFIVGEKFVIVCAVQHSSRVCGQSATSFRW